jgi:mRNA interferase RelE/StbE
MKTYQVILLPGAYKDLRTVPAQLKNRVRAAISALATDPYPDKARQLRDPYSHFYRIRIEAWRIIYSVDEDIVVVEVAYIRRKTGPETYEDL